MPTAPIPHHGTFEGIIAGGITGGLEICITYPTEFVKTHIQLDEKGAKKQYSGIMDVITKTYNRRGILGFYRGLSILIAGSIPKQAVRFGSFETIKNQLTDESGALGNFGKLLSGLGAGVVESIICVTPMETIKVQLIHDQRQPTHRYHGLIHGTGLIVKEQGITGIYKGVIPTTLRQGSNQAVRFFMMEYLKEWYRAGDLEAPVPKIFTAMFGVVAATLSVMSNTPLDVVKTRMQGLESQKYKGTWDCIKQIWHKEGMTAFYKGNVPRLFRGSLDVAISFVIYDSIMEVFEKMWPEGF